MGIQPGEAVLANAQKAFVFVFFASGAKNTPAHLISAWKAPEATGRAWSGWDMKGRISSPPPRQRNAAGVGQMLPADTGKDV
jgi:hypothetical protein